MRLLRLSAALLYHLLTTVHIFFDIGVTSDSIAVSVAALIKGIVKIALHGFSIVEIPRGAKAKKTKTKSSISCPAAVEDIALR